MNEFETVLRETQSVVRAYIAGMGIPLDLVDDLAQEVYLEYHRGSARRPSEVEPVRWLKGIAKNLCLNHFRRSRRAAARHQEAVAELLERAESAGRPPPGPGELDGCVEELPGRSREMVALRYREGMESAAIGKAVGLSAEAVRIALLRIRSALRDCLDRGLAGEGAP
ncbi:MAG TPA: sigma-70 family RNA polymerase sigma factor [Planctomycetota bacterium]|nr:sigma-70 family RNA polymerase sigma factor [Planctomycetota bacterium]